jgi:hypothetical protein
VARGRLEFFFGAQPARHDSRWVCRIEALVRRILSIGLLVSVSGCGGALAEGQSQFQNGRYAEAKQTFASCEAESRSWADERRARYALYRGLTLGALGDRAQAGVWLREAKAIHEVHPASLSGEDAQRLRLGLESNDAD